MSREGLPLDAVPQQDDPRGLRDVEDDRVHHAVDPLDLLGRAARRGIRMVRPAQIDVGDPVGAELHAAERHPFREGAGEPRRLGTGEEGPHHLADAVLRRLRDRERARLGAQPAAVGREVELEAHRRSRGGGRLRPGSRGPRPGAAGEPPPQPAAEEERQRETHDEARRAAAHDGLPGWAGLAGGFAAPGAGAGPGAGAAGPGAAAAGAGCPSTAALYFAMARVSASTSCPR